MDESHRIASVYRPTASAYCPFLKASFPFSLATWALLELAIVVQLALFFPDGATLINKEDSKISVNVPRGGRQPRVLTSSLETIYLRFIDLANNYPYPTFASTVFRSSDSSAPPSPFKATL